MTARVSMLLKSRASSDMLPFSLCNKKRLAIRHMNRPLFPTIFDSVLRHREEGRAKNLSPPPRNSRCTQPPLLTMPSCGEVFHSCYCQLWPTKLRSSPHTWRLTKDTGHVQNCRVTWQPSFVNPLVDSWETGVLEYAKLAQQILVR